LRLKAAYHPDSLSEAEQAELAQSPLPIRVGRFLRKRVYRRVFKKKRWLERLERWGLRRPAAAKEKDRAHATTEPV
jgi:hypothetical protein